MLRYLKHPQFRSFVRATALLVVSLCLVAASCNLSSQDVVNRVVAAAGCVAALAGAGIQIAGDPALGGAITAINVATEIAKYASGSLPATLINACASTIALAGQDASGLVAQIKGTTAATPATPTATTPTTPTARVAPKALIPKPAYGPDPTIVKVPLH